MFFQNPLKAGKSPKYNFKNDGHLTSGPVVHVQLKEGSIPTFSILPAASGGIRGRGWLLVFFSHTPHCLNVSEGACDLPDQVLRVI